MQIYEFPKGSVKTCATCDVLVAGGGTAGAFAGISAAREGADALIVETFGTLGGSQTLALVTPVMHTHMDGNPQSSALADETWRRLEAMGAANKGESSYFDPMAMQCVLEDMVGEAGCRVLYHTTLIGVIKEGQQITHGVVFNTDGVQAIAAKQFIDATADGALSILAGADFESGDEDGKNQAVSLRFIMEGVDVARFVAYNNELGDSSRAYPHMHAASVHDNPRWKLNAAFDQALADGLLTLQDVKYFQCFSIPGRPSAVAFNCPELGARVGVMDPDFLTERQMEGKRAIRRLARFLRERVPGYENAYVSEIAPMLGIREGRRVVCEYMITGEDIASCRPFDDYIANSNYPVDIHDAKDGKLRFAEARQGKYYQLPLRSLMVRGLDNLFVAGRCLGADFIAQSALRVQSTCRASGEAAGIAASMAAREGKKAREMRGEAVREVMLTRGARFVIEQ